MKSLLILLDILIAIPVILLILLLITDNAPLISTLFIIYLIIAITVFLISVSFSAYQSYQHHKRFEAQKSEIEKKINDLFKD